MSSFEALHYDEFVVVAEEEWEISCDNNEVETGFSTRIGNYKWSCFFNYDRIVLQCENREMIEGIAKEIHIEVILYFFQNEQYCRMKQNSERTLLKKTWSQRLYNGPINEDRILLTIRILKDRKQFPSFTAPNYFGNFSSNVKLRIGEQIYYVNKQLLSWFSPYFDRLFNDGNYKESKQEEIELKLDGLAIENTKVFEDFLLSFCPPGQIEVLPNSQNVADLLELAEYFQVDLLKKKCERHLELAREKDVSERVLLAKKFGLEELQTKLVKGCSAEESKRISLALLKAP